MATSEAAGGGVLSKKNQKKNQEGTDVEQLSEVQAATRQGDRGSTTSFIERLLNRDTPSTAWF